MYVLLRGIGKGSDSYYLIFIPLNSGGLTFRLSYKPGQLPVICALAGHLKVKPLLSEITFREGVLMRSWTIVDAVQTTRIF